MTVPMIAPVHPLDPLSAHELQEACDLVRTHVDKTYRSDQSTSPRIWFKSATLREPPKAALVPFLDSLHEGRRSPQPLPRRADVLVGVKTNGNCQWLGECLCKLHPLVLFTNICRTQNITSASAVTGSAALSSGSCPFPP